MTKKLKLLLLALLLVLIGFGLFYSPKPSSQPSKNEAAQVQVVLTVDYGEGKKESVSFIPQPQETVFEALKSFAQEKKIALDIQKYDFGVFVKAIGEYLSSSEKAWIYFVNGNPGTIAADQQEIKAGDTIEWRYIKPQE